MGTEAEAGWSGVLEEWMGEMDGERGIGGCFFGIEKGTLYVAGGMPGWPPKGPPGVVSHFPSGLPPENRLRKCRQCKVLRDKEFQPVLPGQAGWQS